MSFWGGTPGKCPLPADVPIWLGDFASNGVSCQRKIAYALSCRGAYSVKCCYVPGNFNRCICHLRYFKISTSIHYFERIGLHFWLQWIQEFLLFPLLPIMRSCFQKGEKSMFRFKNVPHRILLVIRKYAACIPIFENGNANIISSNTRDFSFWSTQLRKSKKLNGKTFVNQKSGHVRKIPIKPLKRFLSNDIPQKLLLKEWSK